MKCYVCNQIVQLTKSFLYEHENKKYFRCNSCLLVFQNPLPSNAELKNLYNKEYFNQNYSDDNNDYNLRKIQYKLDKKIILNHYKDKKFNKILDYGCGNGNFLKLFKSKKFGFEFNNYADVDKSIKRLNHKQVYDQEYDLIIMRGVIEHIPKFNNLIKKLSKCVKQDGLFFITATPNSNNLTFFLSNKDFNQNHPGHLYHFNNVNLSLLFLKNNFHNIDMRFEYVNTPYANLKNDFNYLKNQLKRYHNKKISTYSPPSVGNMMTAIFKKMK